MPRWMEQQARNATMEEWGFLRGCRYLLHDRDTKFCASFRELIESGSIKTIRLPVRSPNLNSFAERWVRSVKEECLSRLILFGESSLRRALQNVVPVVRQSRFQLVSFDGTNNSTDRSFANPRVVPELTRKPSGWCGWRRKIPGGAMTGS